MYQQIPGFYKSLYTQAIKSLDQISNGKTSLRKITNPGRKSLMSGGEEMEIVSCQKTSGSVQSAGDIFV
jgi:hypothetical protein